MPTDPPRPSVLAVPGRVPVLFAGAVRAGREAVAALDDGRDAEAAARVARVQAILAQLAPALGGESEALARHLDAIHDYLGRRLSSPAVGRDGMLQVIADIETIAAGWATLSRRTVAAPAT
ncbi:MAG TPA: flagellar protein FliS, partial [Miltoncostaeaceae bacterium]|nr:flagellar protein FliS [Miltoncostaeaceae bacterium]